VAVDVAAAAVAAAAAAAAAGWVPDLRFWVQGIELWNLGEFSLRFRVQGLWFTV
jgi:hypothetical protein